MSDDNVTKLTVEQGMLQGVEREGVYTYKNIPYAASISGENRWRPPQPPARWTGVRDASEAGSICAQPDISVPAWLCGRAGAALTSKISLTGPFGDDCLNLNVWTPSPDPDAKLPVMFWIHGGGFMQGSGTIPLYDGAELAKKGVVVVTINYRLGLAGVLAAPDYFDGDFATPNRGFLDQVKALHWVKQNIRQFGGDPDKITIFGESAGGLGVSVLLASPATKGLFQRAILMSGAPESGASLADHQMLAADFLKKVGIKKGDAAALSQVFPQQLVKWYDIADKIARGAGGQYGNLSKGLGGAPNALQTDFQPVPILDALANGQAKDIDLMLGTTKDEARFFSLILPGPVRLSSRLCLKWLGSFAGPNKSAKQLVKEYSMLMPEASRHLIREQVITDIVFRRGTVRAACAHARTNPGRTFLYQLEWPSPALDAFHGVELGMVFQTLEEFEELYGDIEDVRRFSSQVSDAWVNFAKYGTPSAPGLPVWEAFEEEKRASMVLNTRSEIQYSTDREKENVWGPRQRGATV